MTAFTFKVHDPDSNGPNQWCHGLRAARKITVRELAEHMGLTLGQYYYRLDKVGKIDPVEFFDAIVQIDRTQSDMPLYDEQVSALRRNLQRMAGGVQKAA